MTILSTRMRAARSALVTGGRGSGLGLTGEILPDGAGALSLGISSGVFVIAAPPCAGASYNSHCPQRVSVRAKNRSPSHSGISYWRCYTLHTHALPVVSWSLEITHG
jgi:hypothetical protein